MYKVVNGMSPEIINELLKQRNNPYYNLRHTSQFFVNLAHSFYYATDSALYLEPNIWEQIPSEVRNKESL